MISIVVPIYNAQKYLSDCLDTLVAQANYDIEILCVDDGSTDQTIDILSTYTEKYPFLRVVNQHNQGPSAAVLFQFLLSSDSFFLYQGIPEPILKKICTWRGKGDIR